MGYRSEVKVVFYTYDKTKLPLLKLWLAERWDVDPEEYGLPYVKTRISFEANRVPDSKYAFWGYLYEFNSIKWYESYEDIDRWDNEFLEFDKLCDPETNQFAAEFIRVGEDSEDIEERGAGDIYGCLSAYTVIEADVTKEQEDGEV